MTDLSHAVLPDRFELQAQARRHSAEVLVNSLDAATDWLDSHLRALAQRASGAVPHQRYSAH